VDSGHHWSDALAHEIEDYAEFEEMEASQFDVDWKALAEKASGWDRLTIFAILLASAGLWVLNPYRKGSINTGRKNALGGHPLAPGA